MANPYRAIKTLCDQIDEPVGIAGVDVQLRMALRQSSQHGGEMGWAEREWRGDPQTTAKLTGGQDRFLGQVDLGAGSGCVVSKNSPGFRERGTACGSRQKLNAKFRLKAE